MLYHKAFIFLGGDERYIYAMNRLKQERASIYTNGFSNVSLLEGRNEERDLSSLPFHDADGIILPVLGTDDNGWIQQHYPDKKIQLTEDVLQRVGKNCLIFTGVATDYLKRLCETSDKKLIALYERDHVAIYNSIPTAEATVQIAMENTNYTMHGATVLVAGFGR